MKKSRLQVELAKDDHTRQTGLMYRKHLAENAGMLFCFGSEGHYSFWMQNTYIPLDIAFLDKFGKVLEIKPLYPLSTRSVQSSHSCKYALEVNRGWFDDNGVRVGTVLFPSNSKQASGDEQAVRLVRDFKGAVDLAVRYGWNIIISYRPVGKTKSKAPGKSKNETPYKIDPYGIHNKQDYPDNYVKDYELIFSRKVDDLPGEIKPYAYESGKGGEKITARVAQVSGEPRSFILDRIDQYAFRKSDGTVVRPEDLTAEDIELVQEDEPQLVEDVVEDRESEPEPEPEFQAPKRRPTQDFERDRGDMGETINFWDSGIPAKPPTKKDPPKPKVRKDKVEPPKPKPKVKPQVEKKKPWWKGYKDMWGLLRKNEEAYREFQKQSAGGGGESGEGNMMTQYWNDLKKKRGQGLTEGEAILEYLKQNENRQKQSRS